MKKFKYIVGVYIFFFAGHAFAYLDPGSVSLLVQAVIGGVAAVASTWKLWWGTLKNRIIKIFKKNK